MLHIPGCLEEEKLVGQWGLGDSENPLRLQHRQERTPPRQPPSRLELGANEWGSEPF